MRPTKIFERFNDSQRHALDAGRNLAVRAGAGSGKTSVLVERIVQLLARGLDEGQPRELAEIVALTFTRKAAGALRDRLRASFQEMAATAADDEQAYWLARIAELPEASIGTIDSFCARVLRDLGHLDEEPLLVEPTFVPLSDYEEAVLKQAAIERVIERLNSLSAASTAFEEREQAAACRWWGNEQGFDNLVRHLTALLDHVVDPEIIVSAHEEQGSAEARVETDWAHLPAVERLRREASRLQHELQDLLLTITGLSKPSASVLELSERLQRALAALAQPEIESEVAVLDSLREAFCTKSGEPRVQGLTSVAERVQPLQDVWCPLLAHFAFDFDAEVSARAAADRLVLLLAPVQAEYLRLCRAERRYDFLTLARRTRDLLQHSEQARQVLWQRVRFVLVDEFQDTNQLQWEIISWLVGAGPNGPLDADRLFIVGDPQQSIYRFRHADVGVFRRVRKIIIDSNLGHGHGQRPTDYETAGGRKSTEDQRLGALALAENYRTLSPTPLGLLERIFRHVFDPRAHGLDLEKHTFEVSYQPLLPGKLAAPERDGEVCYVLPLDTEEDDPEDDPEEKPHENLRHPQVRAVVAQLIDLHGQPRLAPEPGGATTLRWCDFAVLLPSRDVALSELEKEFRRRQVPFIVHKGIGFWQRQEVRDVVNLASCLADPDDELSLFGVLRGPIGQCTDAEILFLSQLGQSRIVRGLQRLADGEVAAGSADPVRLALSEFRQRLPESEQARLKRTAQRLRRWWEGVDHRPHADLLQQVLEESGAHVIYAAEPEGRLIEGNLDKLFDMVRELEERSPSGLAQLARQLRSRVDDSAKEEQAAVDLADDAVKVMTVHASKGLEFPVVAVLKMERLADQASHARLLVVNPWESQSAARPGTIAVSVRHPHRPREMYKPLLLRELQELERAQDLAESRRLFYVAATRAQERLILAGKPPRSKQNGGTVKLRESWQKWFEEALGITDEHKRAGLWQDASTGQRVAIITAVAEGDEVAAVEPVTAAVETLDLAPVPVEIGGEAVTIEGLLAQSEPPETAVAARVLGVLTARLLAESGRRSHRGALQSLAAGLCAEQGHILGKHRLDDIVAEAEQLLAQIRESGSDDLIKMARACSDFLVPFTMMLGRWRVLDHFPSLLRRKQTCEVVDWVVEATPHRLPLLALALQRCGAASGPTIVAHQVVLRSATVQTRSFTPADLQEAATAWQ